MRLTRAFLLIGGVTALASCGPQQAESVDPRTTSYVEVRNQSVFAMTIYVLRGATRVRLGTVSPSSTEVLEIPRTYVNPGVSIQFLMDPQGSTTTPVSQSIAVSPGDTVVLIIPPTL